MATNLKNLGLALKLIRVGQAIKQKDLALKVGISATYLSMIEKEKAVPSVELIDKLSVELSTPVYLIFFKAHTLTLNMEEFNSLSVFELNKVGQQMIYLLKNLLLQKALQEFITR